jgi:hypothetical protein
MEFAIANPEIARILNHEGVTPGPRLAGVGEKDLRPVFRRGGEYLG